LIDFTKKARGMPIVVTTPYVSDEVKAALLNQAKHSGLAGRTVAIKSDRKNNKFIAYWEYLPSGIGMDTLV
jgi:hypothetical protein